MRYLHIGHPKRMQGQSGFTLLEVLVAMALFMVAIAGTLSMYGRSVENNQLSMISTRVTNLAYERMDKLVSLPYTDTFFLPGAKPPEPFTLEELNVTGEMFWTVLPESNAIRNTKMVMLNLFWRRGREHPHGPFTLTFLKPEML